MSDVARSGNQTQRAPRRLSPLPEREWELYAQTERHTSTLTPTGSPQRDCVTPLSHLPHPHAPQSRPHHKIVNDRKEWDTLKTSLREAGHRVGEGGSDVFVIDGEIVLVGGEGGDIVLGTAFKPRARTTSKDAAEAEEEARRASEAAKPWTGPRSTYFDRSTETRLKQVLDRRKQLLDEEADRRRRLAQMRARRERSYRKAEKMRLKKLKETYRQQEDDRLRKRLNAQRAEQLHQARTQLQVTEDQGAAAAHRYQLRMDRQDQVRRIRRDKLEAQHELKSNMYMKKLQDRANYLRKTQTRLETTHRQRKAVRDELEAIQNGRRLWEEQTRVNVELTAQRKLMERTQQVILTDFKLERARRVREAKTSLADMFARNELVFVNDNDDVFEFDASVNQAGDEAYNAPTYEAGVDRFDRDVFDNNGQRGHGNW